MKPKTQYFIIGIVCFSLLFISALGEQKAGWKGKIEQEKGVKVVKNPEEPLYGEIEFELELDLSIGGEEFDENYNFIRVSDVEVDDPYLVRHCINAHRAGGLYMISWYTGSMNDPVPHLEIGADVSGGFGHAIGDPIYGIYLYDSSGGPPAFTSSRTIESCASLSSP